MTRLNPHNIPNPLIIILNIFIRRFDRSLPKFFELAESEICEEQPEPVMAEYDGEHDYIEIKNENIRIVYVAIGILLRIDIIEK